MENFVIFGMNYILQKNSKSTKSAKWDPCENEPA